MQIVHTIQEMRQACKHLRWMAGPDATLGFVPTMGAIHAGHLSLVRAAREECKIAAASIFVNPMQFGPTEDFSRYPRTFEEDCQRLEDADVDLLFVPEVAEMYPPEVKAFVEVAGVSDRLDGASRPGHFRGVATVVAKLFNIVSPDVGYFGQKDAAQVAVLQAMVRDLNMSVEICVCPTVRERDGLAMSSRNRYLSSLERQQSLALRNALMAANQSVVGGERDASQLRAVMFAELSVAQGVRVDYADVVRADTLEPLEFVEENALLVVAAWVGKTRLIDNMRIEPPLEGTLDLG